MRRTWWWCSPTRPRWPKYREFSRLDASKCRWPRSYRDFRVQVEGSYNTKNQLVASSIKFKGNDLEDAQTIQAGLQPTKEQIQQTQEELAEQKAALERQQQEMQEQQQQMAAAQAKIDANKAAVEAANKRFGQLDDYNILDEVTVYFGNGKVALDPKYNPQPASIG